MRSHEYRQIWEKTNGHCHFCGDPVVFEKRGWRQGDMDGYWEADHVVQRAKGGSPTVENCLPACTRCNRLRWFYKGEEIRELLLLGVIAKAEVNKGSTIGQALVELKKLRLEKNLKRRKSHRLATELLVGSDKQGSASDGSAT